MRLMIIFILFLSKKKKKTGPGVHPQTPITPRAITPGRHVKETGKWLHFATYDQYLPRDRSGPPSSSLPPSPPPPSTDESPVPSQVQGGRRRPPPLGVGGYISTIIIYLCTRYICGHSRIHTTRVRTYIHTYIHTYIYIYLYTTWICCAAPMSISLECVVGRTGISKCIDHMHVSLARWVTPPPLNPYSSVNAKDPEIPGGNWYFVSLKENKKGCLSHHPPHSSNLPDR